MEYHENKKFTNSSSFCGFDPWQTHQVFENCSFFVSEPVHFYDSTFINCTFENFQGMFSDCLIRATTIRGVDDVYIRDSSVIETEIDMPNFRGEDSVFRFCRFYNTKEYFNLRNCSCYSEFYNCNPEEGHISCSSIEASVADGKCDFSRLTTDNTNHLYGPRTAAIGFPVSYVCPVQGSFVAYKKLANNLIATLLIPENAKRVGSMTRKCRADVAQVLEITDLRGNEFTEGFSMKDIDFIYKVGEEVKAHRFDDNPGHECAAGIHFFMTYDEAAQFQM